MRFLLSKVLTLSALLCIIVAVLLTLARLALPFASHYPEEIQHWVSVELGQSVKIKSLTAEWQGFGPLFNFNDLAFLDPASGGVRASLKQASIAIDIPASLFNAEWRFGNLTVSEVELSVIRQRDGSVAVAGMAGVAEENVANQDSGSGLLNWLFSQDRLALAHSTIYWFDEHLAQGDLQFVNVNLELRNDGDRHQFDGSASLPNDLGRRFSFAVDLQGDIAVAGGWSAKAYLNGAGLQASSLLNWLPLAGVQVDSGVGEVRLWGEWEASRLQQLDGEMSAFGLHLSTRPSIVHKIIDTELLDSLSGRFSWKRKEAGWHFSIERLTLGRQGHFWPQGSYHLAWSDASLPTNSEHKLQIIDGAVASESQHLSVVDSEAQTPGDELLIEEPTAVSKLKIWADYVQVDDVLSLLLLTDLPLEQLREAVDVLQPSGELSQLNLQLQPSTGQFAIDSDFADVSIQPWKRMPGISGLGGHVIADNNNGKVELHSQSMLFEAKPLFRQILPINTLQGIVQWQQIDESWYLSGRSLRVVNSDINLDADLDLLLPMNGQSPLLDLTVGFTSFPNAVGKASAYLPTGIMSKNTVRWLDHALVNGTVASGGFIFHGTLNRFPFVRTDGQFEVRLVVDGGVLDYASDWPRLEQLETEVYFAGREMAINGVSGSLLNAGLKGVQARIVDLSAKPAVLTVIGNAFGATADVLRFLQVSPLHERYGQYVDGVQASGDSTVSVDLQLPLSAGADSQVNGIVALQDSAFVLADGAVDLSELNGRLSFSSAGLAADDITGKVLGLDARFTVVTEGDDADRVTTVSGQGLANIDDVRQILDPPLFDQFSGYCDWQARVRIPGLEGAGVSLQVSSDLLGLATNLPVPLSKPADQVLPMVAELDFPVTLDRPVTVSLGDEVSIILDLDEHMQVQRGEFRFSDGAAQLPERPGVRVVGTLPEFSFSQWLPLFEHIATNSKGSSDIEGVNEVDATVADIELFHRHLDLATVQAQLKGSVWHTTIDAKQAKGTVQVPIDTDHPLIMDMEYLHIVSAGDAGSTNGEDDDPREWPPMRIESQSFHYDAIDFGTLALTASRNPAGLHLSELQMQAPELDIKARGDWLVAEDEQYSSFNITFNSTDVGKSMSRFGYADTIKGGKGEFAINARWPGNPISFALAQLDGNMQLRITDGRLLEVNPGVGRIFGLLSLQALPRRLILDFSDVFSKGFSFDRITGDFNVRSGQATTTNLIMKGPAAKIGMDGKIGLTDQTYDQLVTVVPDVAATVPMLTALTQGAGVGVVVLLLKKLLEPGIDKASMIVYKVTGPWDSPLVERIEEIEQLTDTKGVKAESVR